MNDNHVYPTIVIAFVAGLFLYIMFTDGLRMEEARQLAFEEREDAHYANGAMCFSRWDVEESYHCTVGIASFELDTNIFQLCLNGITSTIHWYDWLNNRSVSIPLDRVADILERATTSARADSPSFQLSK